MKRAIFTIAALLALPAAAHANQIHATRCDGTALPVATFGVDETVCVAGDVDYTCPVGPWVDLPAADVYVVARGADPFSAPAVHFETMGGAGSFWDITVMRPPLAPGVYDLFLDEHCDGVRTGDDVLLTTAFVVGGELSCDAPPGSPIDPGIPSGALCRGACGGNCPSSCTAAEPRDVCVDDAALCEHMTCRYEGLVCGTHEGCRVHDDCYDACAAAGAGFMCWRRCDLDCLNTFGLPCGSWARGGGPYDATLTFYEQTSSSGSSAGLCSGSC